MRIRTAVQGFYEHLISVHSLECVIFCYILVQAHKPKLFSDIVTLSPKPGILGSDGSGFECQGSEYIELRMSTSPRTKPEQHYCSWGRSGASLNLLPPLSNN